MMIFCPATARLDASVSFRATAGGASPCETVQGLTSLAMVFRAYGTLQAALRASG